MGIDGISPKVLKRCPVALIFMNQFIIYFISVCNRVIFLLNGVFTRLSLYLSQASVTNYHPITVLCTISEVLELIVYDKIISQQISTSQFDFVTNCSTLQQLLVFLSDIHWFGIVNWRHIIILILRRLLIQSFMMNYFLNCGQLALMALSGNGFMPI